MEGSPENKRRRVRAAQFDLSRRRIMQDVARATVVITNPTHFAVAIEYRRDTMPAPQVLAMGADHVALRVRDVARYHGVPIIENKALKRKADETGGRYVPFTL